MENNFLSASQIALVLENTADECIVMLQEVGDGPSTQLSGVEVRDSPKSDWNRYGVAATVKVLKKYIENLQGSSSVLVQGTRRDKFTEVVDVKIKGDRVTLIHRPSCG